MEETSRAKISKVSSAGVFLMVKLFSCISSPWLISLLRFREVLDVLEDAPVDPADQKVRPCPPVGGRPHVVLVPGGANQAGLSVFHSFILPFFHSPILSFCHSVSLSFFHYFILAFFHSFTLSHRAPTEARELRENHRLPRKYSSALQTSVF